MFNPKMYNTNRLIKTIKIAVIKCNNYSSHAKLKNQLELFHKKYEADSWTNITPKIISYLGKSIYLQKNHPLSLIRLQIVEYFYKNYVNTKGNPLFSVYDSLSPVVTAQQNFDDLLIPKDHVSRKKSDCYYVNQEHLLRAHMTAHQFDLIKSGLDNFLMIGDVYRRDEIDSTHYPVFHQVDGVRIINKNSLFRNNSELEIMESSFKVNPQSFSEASVKSKCLDEIKQPCHTLEAVKLVEYELKSILSRLAKRLFGEKVEYRWVDAYFPFTQPSWELEILHNKQWIEVLGTGVMRNEILQRAGVYNSIGYAFGLGLERLSMILYDIPDIRLFWSTDSGFLNQFNEKTKKYKPVSSYPQCTNDISFWLPENCDIDEFEVNDFYDLARSVGGDVIEQISLVDKFKHPKSGKSSLCFRIVYRHMEKTLTQHEVNEIHKAIGENAIKSFHIVIR